ncbi:MAG: RluA family pseudouridine synthase, partial [Shewanella sp.]
DTVDLTPPAGAGECAAPKLLQYAFKHRLKPLAMAEFWWGAPPKSAIRQHKQFYPACLRKCQPILKHMLEGLAVDDNPLRINPAAEKPLEIVYQDDALAIVNKPAELLSVPGKEITDSVYLRMQQTFPEATGPLIVHRLDMSTSGIMVIALTKASHKQLQKQFIQRRITKRYVALLEGSPKALLQGQREGNISLPLRGDLDDRPRQLVCPQWGKAAHTHWELKEIDAHTGNTRVYLYPHTGRTHQLRVHCAHHEGLDAPIVGDDLYGKRAERLHLHADLLAFTHPLTGLPMQFQVDPAF